jgi:glutamyl-tRNA reductase
MIEIVLTGLNHNTASVDIRERLAFSGDEAGEALDHLARLPQIKEVVLISTCNRVEILMTSERPKEAVESVNGFISEFKGIEPDRFKEAMYVNRNDEAIRHIFRVAASLDSMMIGEPQILGQIKSAYYMATRKKTSGVVLNRLLHRAFFVAKRVRTETGIGDHAVSISHAAVELGRKIFGDLEGKQALLIGAGEMAELAVERLIRDRAGKIFVANRTFERGMDLASTFGGEAIRFEEIFDYLKQVDIIISSTGAPDFVIDQSHVKGLMKVRKNRPLFFIDIAVPRDIDPGINKNQNMYVYDIDDLKGVVDDNIEDRRNEASKGERIIDEAVIRFRRWYESLDVVPTIVGLRRKMEVIVEAELKKTFKGLGSLSESDRESVRRMAESVIKKCLHDPTLYLKSEGCRGNDKSMRIDMVRKLFRLDDV